MSEIVLYEGDEPLDINLLYERVASFYLEMQRERGAKRVRVSEAVVACVEAHPEYDQEEVGRLVRSREFDTYLAQRRKRFLVEQLVPQLIAAEQGARIGELAAAQLLARLEEGERIPIPELVKAMKAGYELAEKIDKKVEEATGTQNVKVNVDLKGLLLGLPVEMAQQYMAEVGRRLLAEGQEE